MHLRTNWTPLHAEPLAAWGAHGLPRGPTVLVVLSDAPEDADQR